MNPTGHGERLAKISCVGVRGCERPFQLSVVKLVGEQSQRCSHRGLLKEILDPGSLGDKHYSEPLQPN
jgi:hypothetical protein